jgi:hypothetical protein
VADVIFVAVIVAFFGVAWALVKACDRIIGPDIVPVDELEADGTDSPAATPGRSEVLAS